MQDVIIAGDTLDFETTVDEFANDVYTLRYRLTPVSSSGTAITFDATAVAGDLYRYRSQVGPATTATWGAEDYEWTAWVFPTADPTTARYTVDRGNCTIKPDPAEMAAGTDSRSFARKMVAQLEAAMLSYTTSNGKIKEYEIAGRRMVFRDGGQILSDLSRWRAEVWREDAKAAMLDGQPNPRNVQVRFARA